MQIRSFIIGDLALCLIEGNDPRFDNRLDIINATRRLFPVVFREYFLSQPVPDGVDIVAEMLNTIDTHVEGIHSREWYYALCAEIRSWIAARLGRWERVTLKYHGNVFSILCYGDYRVYRYELEHGRGRVSFMEEGEATAAMECQFVTDPLFVADTLTPEASEDIIEAYENRCDIEYTVDLPISSEVPDKVIRMRQDDLDELFAMPERDPVETETFIDDVVAREIKRIRSYKVRSAPKEEKPIAKHAKTPKRRLEGTIEYVHEGAPRGPWSSREKVDMHKAVNRSRMDSLGSSLVIRQTCSFPK